MYDPKFGVAARKARIEIIPLIDVVFFLLATFVLFTLSLEKLRVLSADFPVPGDPSPVDTTVYVGASDQNLVSWKEGRDGAVQLIPLGELGPRLADYQSRVSPARVAIGGDRRASFGMSVSVLDAVRKAGIKQICMETLEGAASP